MRCAWKEFLGIIPQCIREDVNRCGREHLQELRLRINAPPELVLPEKRLLLEQNITQRDLDFVINTATKYSPWSAASSSQGYITAPGGHRIGLCGEVVLKDGHVAGIRSIRSICIRVARDFPGIGKAAAALNSSVLILGAPGTGKTTLLRDIIRHLAKTRHVAVVDERNELFPINFEQGIYQDTLSGCSKEEGVEMLLRTMGPEFIAVDEITAEKDSLALIQASCCGVFLLATAHAGSLEDFYNRRAYAPIRESMIFQNVLVLHKNKTFTMERMK